MNRLVKVRLEEGSPMVQRILLKNVKNRDDLEQLYCVIRASVAGENNVFVEVYEEVKVTPITPQTQWEKFNAWPQEKEPSKEGKKSRGEMHRPSVDGNDVLGTRFSPCSRSEVAQKEVIILRIGA